MKLQKIIITQEHIDALQKSMQENTKRPLIDWSFFYERLAQFNPEKNICFTLTNIQKDGTHITIELQYPSGAKEVLSYLEDDTDAIELYNLFVETLQ